MQRIVKGLVPRLLEVKQYRWFVSENMSEMAENRLGQQLSPYLKQHKNNPVDWYPWGQEAIQKARDENKMIFLSIGYSTCHWCHVMERESFENDQVAQVMNENYVNIKVDREERPDVDKVYMTFVQATTGSGGWPLSLWLSPDLKPVFGGTYFPPTGNFGRPGFTEILKALAGQWEENSDDMAEAGTTVMDILKKRKESTAKSLDKIVAPETLQKAFAQLAKSYDPDFGGFSKAPKFPQPSNMMLLLRLQDWSEERVDRKKRGLQMTQHTLDMMAKGGIHDHISKGFARYSTDAEWHVPHFEKMLYDQAQLAMAYTGAAKITGDKKYEDVVDDILEYVTRDVKHPLGGFFSAEDADSLPKPEDTHKKEGAFCVWEIEEVRNLLDTPIEGTDKTIADIVIHHYNMKDGGNVNPNKDPHGELKGKNVLTELPLKEKIVDENKYDLALATARGLMYQERLKRPRPGLDDKIIAAWNGLMISAFAKAGSAFNRKDYLEVAIKAGKFIKTHMFNEESGTLLRSVYGGKDELEQLEAPIHGFTDDYVFVIQSLLDLYQATLDVTWLEFAHRLQTKQDELFLDRDGGGYFSSQEGDEEIVLRLKDDQDGAEPSNNSIAAMNLLRLGKILDDVKFEEEGVKIFKAFSEYLEKYPVAVPAMTEALLFHTQNLPMIIFTGDAGSNPLLKECQSKHMPSNIFIGADGNLDSILYQRQKVLSEINHQDGSLAFVVKNGKVSEGVKTFDELSSALKA